MIAPGPLCMAIKLLTSHRYIFLIFQNIEQEKFSTDGVSLDNAIQTMDTNPIKTAITVCDELIGRKVTSNIW